MVLIVAFVAYYTRVNNSRRSEHTQINKDKFETLLEYVQTDKEQKEREQTIRNEEQTLKDIAKAEKREKLETFKRTKNELRDKLRAKFDAKDWQPIETVLNRIDKGNIGTYVLYNETKNKYYVGQAKESLKRIRDHFKIEQIAIDHRDGDIIKFKVLDPVDASELYSDYRIDHIEKAAIEAFDANTSGYNKTTGNL